MSKGVTVISKPIVPLTLELEEQGGKSDIKPHGAINFWIDLVRRGKGDIKPNGAIDSGIVPARG